MFETCILSNCCIVVDNIVSQCFNVVTQVDRAFDNEMDEFKSRLFHSNGLVQRRYNSIVKA